jgi:glutathione S-transferase
VPTLVDDDAVIIDSAVIMEYLDERYPDAGPSLRPADLVGVARLRSLLRYIDEVPTPAVRIPSYNLAFLPHYQAMTEDAFHALAESKPLRREFLLKMGRTGFSKEEMDSALDRLRRGVGRMHEAIIASGGPFLMGKALTLADIAIMPVIVRLDDIGLASLWDDKPMIAPWFERIRAHPAFAPTYYFGALLTEKYPHLREKFQKAGETA